MVRRSRSTVQGRQEDYVACQVRVSQLKLNTVYKPGFPGLFLCSVSDVYFIKQSSITAKISDILTQNSFLRHLALWRAKKHHDTLSKTGGIYGRTEN